MNHTNRDNRLIYTAKSEDRCGREGAGEDALSTCHRADPVKLNVILWEDAMGGKSVPQMLLEKRKHPKKDDDGDRR